ncbi:nitrate assimilation regulatory protein nirA [Dactylonectria macrodidyma]|uniref:Nitrate assimilation regulatory protein nirA n=1 Tax=Dactylonectria macrodidyma TaxID=307937 RepID=A0A9P9IQ98_9HYPO|nr:nitrate assimilation regulatory protein nirA [Dactylonectria macrodidyma]
MAFRAIKPATLQSRADEAERQTPFRLPKYSNAVQACEYCRKAKTKCDEKRPKCGTCVGRNRPCGYKGEDEQALASAEKSRLESLEQLFANLRTCPPDQADQLVQRIRMSGDPAEVVKMPANPATVRPRPAMQLTQDPAAPCGVFPEPRSAVLPDTSSTQRAIRHELNTSLFPEHPSALTSLTELSSSATDIQLPEAAITAQALEAFFSCSGKLFHVFVKDRISEYYSEICVADGVLPEDLKAKACCVMAVAAVGAQYLPDRFTKEEEARFYNFAKHSFEALIEQQPIYAVKVCTLLAQYNILGKSLVALVYVEIGLSMSRMFGLGQKAVQPNSTVQFDRNDMRKTWRTLVFFSSWLSSTLGYISGNDAISEREILMEMQADDSSDISEVVQTEMAKICILKADILRMQVAFKDLTIPAMQSILKDLQNWHRELPEAMRVEASGNADHSVETRRSIMHVHLLYLGAIMLLYRRVASQFLQSYAPTPYQNALPIPLHGLVAEHSAEAVLSASTSARIMKLLLDDDSIFKRCWLVIFQAYTSGTILLHAVIQKMLHNFKPLSWQEDMERVEDCLTSLEYCGTLDRVAAKFHRRLRGIRDEISQLQSKIALSSSSPVADTAEAMNWSSDSFIAAEGDECTTSSLHYGYLLDIPPNSNAPLVNLSLNLLTMLSQPFGDLTDEEFAETRTSQHWLRDPTRYEYPQMIERLDQNYESSLSFQWNTGKLGFRAPTAPGAVDDAGAPAPKDDDSVPKRFFGSTEPSGWASAAHLTTQVDKSQPPT